MRYRIITFRAPLPANAVASFIREHRSVTRFFAPLAHALDHFIEEKLHHNLDRLEALAHPNEDFLLADPRRPIFVVADGVTLEFNPDGTYPLPSGAARAARLFCMDALKSARRRYKHFSTSDLPAIFRAGNAAVSEYNHSRGRVPGALDYWGKDLFTTTAAFAILAPPRRWTSDVHRSGNSKRLLYWASICDSFVAHYDSHGSLKFRSPECWPSTPERRCFPKDWESRPEEERKKELRRLYRNGLGPKGELIGYGVATGEDAAEPYLNTGTLRVAPGDLVFLYTDGFERYFDLPEFIDLFRRWPHNLKKELHHFSEEKAHENGALYSHDRTLVVLKFDADKI
ncbi:MAG: hypothetical protein Q8R39_02325 [bacterium]|nr:hypothetical protein [bacterium]MDZ4284659.1 hypothetical protein [Patescibacteria group bacterium]